MGGSSSNTSFNYDGQLAADKEVQTVEVGEETKGETRARRNKKYPDLIKYPYSEEKGGLKTVWDAFQRGVTKFPESKCYGTRLWEYDEKSGKYVKGSDGSEKRGKYVWETYKQIDKSARGFGSGLVELKAKAGDNIGIWAVNRTEWMVASLATYSQNMRTVSLYATLGEDAVEYIVNHADIPIVITEKENMKKLIHMLPKMTGVRTIIQIDENALYNNLADKVDEADVKACAEAKVQLIGFNEVIKLGEAKQNFPVPPDEKDLAFIMYTSGTTGQPKGAMLSHGNLMATAAAVPLTIPLKETDCHISYLPLAHIFETVVQVSLLMQGGSIGYFQGNVKKLTNDFIDLEPTIICGVPRVFGRIYQRVFSGVAEKNCIARYFFAKYYAAQCANIRAGRERDSAADKKVFIPLRNKIGLGKTRLMITGAAPCPPYLMEFLKVVTGAMVVQGYGLTETAAATNVSLPNDRNVGHVGPPLPSNEIKLRDVTEMNYLATDQPCPRGEVLIRGANVFQGYFKNEKATTECLDQKDGWFSTGDIGRWNPNGTLSIIDRKKNIFKLSQGEYIAAEKIELVYAKAPTVGQIWVYGNSYKSFVLAVVVPAADVIAKHCVTQGWWPSSEAPQPGTEKFAQDFLKVWEGPHKKALKDHVLNTMREYEKELKGFELVKDVIIEYKIDNMLAGFTEANECLTPTFKLRRPYLLKRYKDALKDMYEQHGEPNKPDEKWPGEP